MTISKYERNRISELEEDIKAYEFIIKDYKQLFKQLRKECDEIIESKFEVIQEYDELKRKLDDVVNLFNTHLYHKKAWSDNPYYDLVQRRLNQIVDGYPVKTTRLRRIYSTEIEQVLKHKNLAECLFLLEKIQMDLEEDE
ncbi:hypothetical protein [Staphylococcus coagulans]|uniref:hypothetical protein n=1 Tax=Staphylococcus coagulans TaxID=74706 RepID=UPI0030EC8357